MNLLDHYLAGFGIFTSQDLSNISRENGAEKVRNLMGLRSSTKIADVQKQEIRSAEMPEEDNLSPLLGSCGEMANEMAKSRSGGSVPPSQFISEDFEPASMAEHD